MNGIDLKKKLRSGQTCLGAWLNLTDPVAPEVMSHVGFDWLFVDTEHAPITLESLQTMILMTQRGGTPTIVRVPWNDMVAIKQTLDVGAEGILVPMIRSAAEARRAVEFAKYPPMGVRGWAPRAASDFHRRMKEYTEQANDRTVVWVQIEHIDAVNDLDNILKVPGLDGVFVGPADLSFSMGIPMQWEHPDLLAAIKLVAQKARAAGVPVGAAVDDTLEETMRWIGWGFQFVSIGLDWTFMREAAKSMLTGVQRALEERK
jgi:2-dehydro-3-deoxyglucarate aldolase